MSDLVHQYIAEIEKPERCQFGASKWIGMQKDAPIPIVAAKRRRTSPAFQLLGCAGEDEDRTQIFDKLGRTVP